MQSDKITMFLILLQEVLAALRETGNEVRLTVAPNENQNQNVEVASVYEGQQSPTTQLHSFQPVEDFEENFSVPSEEHSPVLEEMRKTPSPVQIHRERTPSRMHTEEVHTPPRTPSPVQSFLKDAGLGSVDQTPQPTPRASLENQIEDDEEEEVEEEAEEEEEVIEYEVELVKGAHGLGFTVAGGAQSTGFFYVKDVLYDPALSTGLIEPGDRLIEVR
jgi:hypothetical protein